MMKRRRTIALTCCVLLGLALLGWNSGHNNSDPRLVPASAGNTTTDLQIQSSVLRIEFDLNLHSRVVALFGPSPKLLTPLSPSETVTGIGRTWEDFTLTSTHRELVSDSFGAGERLSLTGDVRRLAQEPLSHDIRRLPFHRHL